MATVGDVLLGGLKSYFASKAKQLILGSPFERSFVAVTNAAVRTALIRHLPPTANEVAITRFAIVLAELAPGTPTGRNANILEVLRVTAEVIMANGQRTVACLEEDFELTTPFEALQREFDFTIRPTFENELIEEWVFAIRNAAVQEPALAALASLLGDELIRFDLRQLREVVELSSGAVDLPALAQQGSEASPEPRELVGSTTQRYLTPMPGRLGSRVTRWRELERLQALVLDGSERQVWVSGMGGSGKTELLRQFVEKTGRHYSSICWITGSDKETMSAGLAAAAATVGLRWESDLLAGRSLVEYWSRTEDAHLFIVDGANSVSSVSFIIPSLPNVTVLMSGRERADVAGLAEVPLGELESEEAARWLMESTGDDDLAAAMDIVLKIRALPLVLAVVASAHLLPGFSTLRTLADQLPGALRPRLSVNEPASGLTIEDVVLWGVARAAGFHVGTYPFLTGACYCAPSPIPLEAFRYTGFAESMEELRTTTMNNAEHFWAAAKYFLVEVDHRAVQVHPYVGLVQRSAKNKDGMIGVRVVVGGLLRYVGQGRDALPVWSLLEIVPHAIELCSSTPPDDLARSEAIRLANLLAETMIDRGGTDAAQQLATAVLSGLNPGDVGNRAKAYNFRGLAYQQSGNLRDSINDFIAALTLPGIDVVDPYLSLSLRNNLGRSLYEMSDGRAESVLRDTLRNKERLYGAVSEELCQTLLNLALVVEEKGDLAESVELLERASRIAHERYGDRPIMRSKFDAQLAVTRVKAGDERGLASLRSAAEEALGYAAENPHIAVTTLAQLMQLLRDSGDDEYLVWLAQAKDLAERYLPERHPLRLQVCAET